MFMNFRKFIYSNLKLFLIRFTENKKYIQGMFYQNKSKIGKTYPTTLESQSVESIKKILTDDFDSKGEGHFVAAPLKGNFLIRTFCGYTPPRKINKNNLGFNWMTIKELDGEFRNLKSDPQLLEIEGVVAKRLPEEYNGNRLGHNWSISWLTDYLNSKKN